MKYEEVYLRAYDSVSHARASLGRYLDLYDCRRPHSSLGARTPEQAFLDPMPQQMQHEVAADAVASLPSGYAPSA